jgi:hypothetical protein
MICTNVSPADGLNFSSFFFGLRFVKGIQMFSSSAKPDTDLQPLQRQINLKHIFYRAIQSERERHLPGAARDGLAKESIIVAIFETIKPEKILVCTFGQGLFQASDLPQALILPPQTGPFKVGVFRHAFRAGRAAKSR